MNLSLYMRFLKVRIDTNPDDNTLDQNLLITLGSVECVAAIRARAIFFLKVISAEGIFGISKYLHRHSQGIGASSAEGIAVSSFNGTFDAELFAKQSNPKGEAAPTSRFGKLFPSAKTSLILCSQKTANPAAKADRAEKKRYIENSKRALEQRSQSSMVRQSEAESTTEKYFALTRWTSARMVDRELLKLEGDRAKCEALKDQGRIRTKGYHWDDLHFPFSVGGKALSISELTLAVKAMIAKEAGRAPPSHPPTRSHRTMRLEPLATLTEEAIKLREECCWSADELAEVRVELQAKREAATAERDRARHDPFAIEQPETPPEPTVGLLIEILTQLQEPTDEGTMRFYNQWLPAVVLQASTGTSKEKRPSKGGGRSTRIRKGYFFVRYDDAVEEWVKLIDDNFNCARKGSWRLDLDEPENKNEAHLGFDNSDGEEAEGAGEGACGSDSETESSWAGSGEEGPVPGSKRRRGGGGSDSD